MDMKRVAVTALLFSGLITVTQARPSYSVQGGTMIPASPQGFKDTVSSGFGGGLGISIGLANLTLGLQADFAMLPAKTEFYETAAKALLGSPIQVSGFDSTLIEIAPSLKVRSGGLSPVKPYAKLSSGIMLAYTQSGSVSFTLPAPIGSQTLETEATSGGGFLLGFAGGLDVGVGPVKGFGEAEYALTTMESVDENGAVAKVSLIRISAGVRF